MSKKGHAEKPPYRCAQCGGYHVRERRGIKQSYCGPCHAAYMRRYRRQASPTQTQKDDARD